MTERRNLENARFLKNSQVFKESIVPFGGCLSVSREINILLISIKISNFLLKLKFSFPIIAKYLSKVYFHHIARKMKFFLEKISFLKNYPKFPGFTQQENFVRSHNTDPNLMEDPSSVKSCFHLEKIFLKMTVLTWQFACWSACLHVGIHMGSLSNKKIPASTIVGISVRNFLFSFIVCLEKML